MADINPSDPTPEEVTDEMAAGAAGTATYAVPGVAASGNMGGSLAAAAAGQIAADALVKDEVDRDDTDLNNADSGDSFAGEGSESPEGARDPRDI